MTELVITLQIYLFLQAAEVLHHTRATFCRLQKWRSDLEPRGLQAMLIRFRSVFARMQQPQAQASYQMRQLCCAHSSSSCIFLFFSSFHSSIISLLFHLDSRKSTCWLFSGIIRSFWTVYWMLFLRVWCFVLAWQTPHISWSTWKL